jgi:uroporphyrinogen decarboxylase
MTKREVIKLVLDKKRPPYVPRNIGLTKEAQEKLRPHFGQSDPSAPLRTSLEDALQNHFLRLGATSVFFRPLDTFQRLLTEVGAS